MNKQLSNVALGIFALCSIAGGLVRADELVNIGTHRLQAHREGHGFPVIVIDSGIGVTFDHLAPLRERLAEHNEVICYNRAGYGLSDPGPLPRNAIQEAEELEALLDSLDVPRPCIFLGHSLGAINVQVFADRYKDDVDGLVLLDPPPLSFIRGEEFGELLPMAEEITLRWELMADSLAALKTPEARKQAMYYRSIASEHREMFTSSARELSFVASFGDFPVLVIASGRPNPAFGDLAESFQDYWIEQCRLMSRQTPWGRFQLAKDSGHNLCVEAPDLVEEGVLDIKALNGGG